MNPTQHTSRRTFLGTLGTLAAGLACGPVISACSGKENALQQEWTIFCRRHAGVVSSQVIPVRKELEAAPCPGHTHVCGRIISFPAQALLAQPVWIYWMNQEQPADVFIRFYRHDTGFSRIATMDRFALEGLNLLSATLQNDKPDLQEEISWVYAPDKPGRGLVSLRIRYQQGGLCLAVTDTQRNIRLEKNIIYHI